MTVPITVVIPVGPRASDCQWLEACLDSVDSEQSVKPAHILFVDDMHTVMAGGTGHDCFMALPWGHDLVSVVPYSVHRNPWNLGVAASFNVGVALAPTEHVLLLGSDDWLEPDAIERAQAAIEARRIEQAYYWFHVRYSDDRPERDQAQPCGAAVVTKALWRATGGFPVESAVGRSDVMLVGLLLGHPEIGSLVEITDAGRPSYNVRIGDWQHTASRGPWVQALETTAAAYWATWAKPAWGRFK